MSLDLRETQPPVVAADQAGMADRNRRLVLDLIKRTGPTSRAALARSITLSKPAISAIVEELIADGFVADVGPDTGSSRGRPGRLLCFLPRSQFVMGVHIGVRKSTVRLADGSGAEVLDLSADTPRGTSAEQVLTSVRRLATAAVGGAGIDASRVVRLTVTVPGNVDTACGVCHSAPNLGWTEVDVRAHLEGVVAGPVDVLNDAQAALVAEVAEGAAKGLQDVVLVYAGTGVSAAVLLGGRPYTGASGAVGEIGHCRVDGATRQCDCGRVGCLETVASTSAVLRRYSSATPGRAPTLTDVIEAADHGDLLAREILAEVGCELGRATALLVNVLNPSAVVLTGSLADAGVHLVQPWRETTAAAALSTSLDVVQLRTAAFGARAELRGAVLHGLRRLGVPA